MEFYDTFRKDKEKEPGFEFWKNLVEIINPVDPVYKIPTVEGLKKEQPNEHEKKE